MAQEPTDVPVIPDLTKLLDGKVAVVTGGGDGIGGAISRLFAEHGAKVEIAEIDPERAERKQTEITDVVQLCAHVVDVRVDDEVAGFAETVVAEHGGVDVLVNNVGDYRPLVRFSRSTPDSWDAMYQVNLRHFFVVTLGVPRPDDRERRRFHRQRALGRGHAGLPGGAGVRCDELAGPRTSTTCSPSSRP